MNYRKTIDFVQPSDYDLQTETSWQQCTKLRDANCIPLFRAIENSGNQNKEKPLYKNCVGHRIFYRLQNSRFFFPIRKAQSATSVILLACKALEPHTPRRAFEAIKRLTQNSSLTTPPTF